MLRITRRSLLALVLPLALLTSALPSGALPAGTVATVYRDAYGVPHVVAPTRQSLAHAVGYVMATDRLFEMDLIRRLGQGRLSEVLGAGRDANGDGVGDALQADMFMRREF